MDFNKLRPDLQSIIDQLLQLTIDHRAVKKSLAVREEIINLLTMVASKAQEQLDKLIPQVEKFTQYTKKKIREQKSRIRKLEDEIEIIQCEKSLLEEKHREEMVDLNKIHQRQLENLKQHYDKELGQLKLVIESQKKSIDELTEQAKRNSDFVHPALQICSKGPTKPKNKQKKGQAFNWPSLDIELTQSQNNNEETKTKKKRRLYTPDHETIVDIKLDD